MHTVLMKFSSLGDTSDQSVHQCVYSLGLSPQEDGYPLPVYTWKQFFSVSYNIIQQMQEQACIGPVTGVYKPCFPTDPT